MGRHFYQIVCPLLCLFSEASGVTNASEISVEKEWGESHSWVEVMLGWPKSLFGSFCAMALVMLSCL